MIRYKKYKDSGIEWIGEIPEDWNTERVKFLANYVKTGSTPPSDSKEYYENGTIDWYSPSDFQQLILKDAKRKITTKAIEDRKCRMYAKGSILLIGIGATVGKIGITNRDCTSNQQINAINFNKKVNPNYIVYYLSSIKDIIVNKADSATLPIFNQTQTKELFAPIPSSLTEQNQIANYLDYKTKQIDELIADKQNLIELLKEYKTALISEVVTGKVDVRDEAF